MALQWKTIDKLGAKVPGATGYHRNGLVEFDVRLGRPQSPLRIDVADDSERFRIENKEYDICVEASTLHEAKQLLRAKLAASDDFTGTWSLWMKVETRGGFDPENYRSAEQADCVIEVRYVVQLVTVNGDRTKRARHMSIQQSLPVPFTGEFWKPTTHAELSRLTDGPAVGRRGEHNKNEVWLEATPQLVETIRALQRRLGASGEAVTAALSAQRFRQTIAELQAGKLLLGNPIDEKQTAETETES